MSWRSMLALLALAFAAPPLIACTGSPQQTANQIMCQSQGASQAALRDRAQACSMVINGGATGEALETALRGRGEANRLLGDTADALADLNRAVALDPEDA